MKMYTRAFNDMRSLNNFVNEAGIAKKDIVSIFQSTDGTYILSYYAE